MDVDAWEVVGERMGDVRVRADYMGEGVGMTEVDGV